MFLLVTTPVKPNKERAVLTSILSAPLGSLIHLENPVPVEPQQAAAGHHPQGVEHEPEAVKEFPPGVCTHTQHATVQAT